MEAYSAGRDGFVFGRTRTHRGDLILLSARIVTLVATAIENRKAHSTEGEDHTPRTTSACAVARCAQEPAPAATLPAHPMQPEGKALSKAITSTEESSVPSADHNATAAHSRYQYLVLPSHQHSIRPCRATVWPPHHMRVALQA